MGEEDLKLIVLDSHRELGEKINEYLKILRRTDNDFIVPARCVRFSTGDGKAIIEGSVRKKDIHIISDVCNYSITYEMYGFINHMGPDEHYQDIKRVICAMSGHASEISVIMPFLYQSRQHKRKLKESLDCALALRELERLGVKNIITVDVHDPSVSNAIPNASFSYFYPTRQILKNLMSDYPGMSDIVVISPDMGAMERARYYADKLKSDLGFFYKRRDLYREVNGKNPIIEHTYLGPDVDGKNIIVVDDMIASGASMLEVCEMLKMRGAKSIYMIATFALFTEGIEKFALAYDRGVFDKVYSTNASYVPKEIIQSDWFQSVDISYLLANIINDLHDKKSLAKYLEK